MMQMIWLSGPPQSGKSEALLALYRHFDVLGMMPVLVVWNETVAKSHREHLLVRAVTQRGLDSMASSRAILVEDIRKFPMAHGPEPDVLAQAMHRLRLHTGHTALVAVRTLENVVR
jgi:hypothetical protein